MYDHNSFFCLDCKHTNWDSLTASYQDTFIEAMDHSKSMRHTTLKIALYGSFYKEVRFKNGVELSAIQVLLDKIVRFILRR